jgi:hypothetical protein
LRELVKIRLAALPPSVLEPPMVARPKISLVAPGIESVAMLKWFRMEPFPDNKLSA